jgi:hypothetical protein
VKKLYLNTEGWILIAKENISRLDWRDIDPTVTASTLASITVLAYRIGKV